MPHGKPGQEVRQIDRQTRVLDLRRAGLSFRAIGRTLEIDVRTAWMAYSAAMKEIIALRNEYGEEHREQELDRLNNLLLALQPKIQKHDAYAIDVARKISESIRKLLGVDAPTKIAPTTPAGDQPYVAKMTQAELDALEQIAEAVTARESSDPAGPSE